MKKFNLNGVDKLEIYGFNIFKKSSNLFEYEILNIKVKYILLAGIAIRLFKNK